MRVDQLLPNFAAHDAIGNHTLQVRRVLREAGFESDIWAEVIDPRVAAHARHYRDYPEHGAGDRVLLYHASTNSEMAGWLERRALEGETLAVDYHNITPARFFARWEPRIADALVEARRELRRLAPHCRLGMADSTFNEAELKEEGYRPTAVCPILVDLAEYDREPDASTLEALARQRAGSRWLFVGRVAPNKCQHDVIAAFALYRRLADPRARLTLAGGASSLTYLRALQRLAAELDVAGSVEILDQVSFPVLLAHYRAADVFVCLSEHEGFCVPALEAMYLGVPVVAYSAGALPETLGPAGVLLGEKDPLVVACTVEDLLSDRARRTEVVAAGRARASELSLPRSSAVFLETLTAWLDGRIPEPAGGR